MRVTTTVGKFLQDGRRYRFDLDAKITPERVAISGVVWSDTHNPRDCERAGQCVEVLTDPSLQWLGGSWGATKRARVAELWDRWHLNDMRPGCEHQRDWPVSERVEIVTYKLTHVALRQRDDALKRAALAGLRGEPLELEHVDRALAEMTDWYRGRTEPPDADSPLSGCYEVSKREQKARGWVLPTEHPLGLLTKPCDVCGYKYGSRWLREEVPPEIMTELRGIFGIPGPNALHKGD